MIFIYETIEKILPFSFMRYDFMVNALLAVLLIAPLLGILGTMAVNNNMAFFSDALGHSALTGIAIGVIFGIENDLISMLALGVALSLVFVKIKRGKTASPDTIISVFSSISIAAGLMILSLGGSFSRYSSYLIGDILSITPTEIALLALTLAAVLAIWYFIWNKLLLISINTELASSRGIRISLIENTFVIMVAVVVMLSIKWIGMLLINSLLILPAASSRNIAKNSRQYLALSVAISVFSCLTGLVASFYLGTSAGATIVLTGAVIFFLSFVFGKKRKA